MPICCGPVKCKAFKMCDENLIFQASSSPLPSSRSRTEAYIPTSWGKLALQGFKVLCNSIKLWNINFIYQSIGTERMEHDLYFDFTFFQHHTLLGTGLNTESTHFKQAARGVKAISGVVHVALAAFF